MPSSKDFNPLAVQKQISKIGNEVRAPEELIVEEQEHFRGQTHNPYSPKTPNPSRSDYCGNGTHSLTEKALAEHDRQQYHLLVDGDGSSQTRRQQSDNLRAVAQSLGIDLPEALLRKMTRTYGGLTPMERFSKE